MARRPPLLSAARAHASALICASAVAHEDGAFMEPRGCNRWQPAMVRRGSPVRVRKRALQKSRKAALSLSGVLARSPACGRYGALHGAFRSRMPLWFARNDHFPRSGQPRSTLPCSTSGCDSVTTTFGSAAAPHRSPTDAGPRRTRSRSRNGSEYTWRSFSVAVRWRGESACVRSRLAQGKGRLRRRGARPSFRRPRARAPCRGTGSCRP